jgi:hypothetical protein
MPQILTLTLIKSREHRIRRGNSQPCSKQWRVSPSLNISQKKLAFLITPYQVTGGVSLVFLTPLETKTTNELARAKQRAGAILSAGWHGW